jgi:hypothetical protein
MKYTSFANLLILGSALGMVPSSYALIGRAAVTQINTQVYGVYLSSDPTCQTGFTAVVELTATPRPFNMAHSPTLGSGEVPSGGIKCVILVMKNDVEVAIAPGTYAGTSNGQSDSVCNAGKTPAPAGICHSGVAVSWPAKITADAAAIGLTLATSCPGAGSTAAVIPLHLSTNSACTGLSSIDASNPSCSGGPDAFSAPTTASDPNFGIHINDPGPAGDFTFVIDPDLSAGNDGSGGGGACDMFKAPLFGFHPT